MSKQAYSATITVLGKKGLADCVMQDMMQKDRSKVTVKRKGSDTIFEVNADDAVALRATINGLTQLIAVYEKMQKV